MRKLNIALAVVLMSLNASAQRHVECLNFGWEFNLNDNDTWKKVDVPHDFQIEQPWVALLPTRKLTIPMWLQTSRADYRAEALRKWVKATIASTTPHRWI